MINVTQYVTPIEPKSAVFIKYEDPCQEHKLACMAAKADLSDYITVYNSTPGTANASGTTASGINSRGVIYTIGYPADILNISFNWIDMLKNQNKILAENLDQQKSPPVKIYNFIDRIEIDIA